MRIWKTFVLLTQPWLAAGGVVADDTGAVIGERLRLIVETDAGGDPDDEQSLVRFLLYVNEWDVEGIIANRPLARDGENLSPERTGLGIVRALVKAYGRCYPNLVQHDRRYPPQADLLRRTVSGYEEARDGVDLILAAVDGPDPRPLWYLNWGTEHGCAASCLKRALDQVLRERGPEGYAKFKDRIRLSSDDQFGDHTAAIGPPWKLWVDTFRPPVDGKRWYHRFSALTSAAGGFDIERDARRDHGLLGALYPTNTTHPQKEGDSMTFLYLVPTGMNDPNEPGWGSWAGRYGQRDEHPGKPYYWANQADAWEGAAHRDNSLRRWAVHLQNDFKARLDWCVKPFKEANHPPAARVEGPLRRSALPGTRVELDAALASDPDGNGLACEWSFYSEPGSFKGPIEIQNAGARHASFIAPAVIEPRTIHIILTVTDDGTPPLSRYRRLIVTVAPAGN